MRLRSPMGAIIDVDDDRAESFVASGYSEVTGDDEPNDDDTTTKSTGRGRKRRSGGD